MHVTYLCWFRQTKFCQADKMHVTYLCWFRQIKILSGRQNACYIPVVVQADKMHVTYLCWANVEGEETAAEKEENVDGVGL